jgi:hypothetical protein
VERAPFALHRRTARSDYKEHDTPGAASTATSESDAGRREVFPNSSDPADDFIEATFAPHFYQPDLQAIRAVLAAVAAHDLTDLPPVWPMLVAPPGCAKTTIIKPIESLPRVFSIDDLTTNTFLSGQINNGTNQTGRKPSLLHRIGLSGIVTISDFSTILGMKPDDRAKIFAGLRRIYDGKYSREVGTSEGPPPWEGRITLVAAVTPAIDGYHGFFQTLAARG